MNKYKDCDNSKPPVFFTGNEFENIKKEKIALKIIFLAIINKIKSIFEKKDKNDDGTIIGLG